MKEDAENKREMCQNSGNGRVMPFGSWESQLNRWKNPAVGNGE
jgi:hypothetical protein